MNNRKPSSPSGTPTDRQQSKDCLSMDCMPKDEITTVKCAIKLLCSDKKGTKGAVKSVREQETDHEVLDVLKRESLSVKLVKPIPMRTHTFRKGKWTTSNSGIAGGLHQPGRIRIASGQSCHQTVQTFVHEYRHSQQEQLAKDILDDQSSDRKKRAWATAILKTPSRRRADVLSEGEKDSIPDSELPPDAEESDAYEFVDQWATNRNLRKLSKAEQRFMKEQEGLPKTYRDAETGIEQPVKGVPYKRRPDGLVDDRNPATGKFYDPRPPREGEAIDEVWDAYTARWVPPLELEDPPGVELPKSIFDCSQGK